MISAGQPDKQANQTSRIDGLDGLRAFAVLLVLVFHFWPDVLPGGFIGVDVFFVISGYLITTLLLRERSKTGRIDLRNFWLRRARRLLPALGLVVMTSITAAWVVSSELLVNIQRQTLGALTFSTNWVEIVAGTDYFAGGDQALFITFWSLAVEEQFYLLWPLILVLALALVTSRYRLAFATLLAAAGSALLMVWSFDPSVSPTRIYYGTDTHCFGLMIGVALAFAMSAGPTVIPKLTRSRMRPLLGLAAVWALAVLAVFLNSSSPFTYRGGIVLASVLSAVAVAVLPGESTIFTRLCCFRPLAWIGERSYGIYLWHWPVLMICSAAKSETIGGTADWTLTLPVIVFTFLLAQASYRWVETPVRNSGFSGAFQTFLSKYRHQKGWRGWPGFATACFSILLVEATIAVVNAPVKSQVQLDVEAGEAVIAEQNSAAYAREMPPLTSLGDPAWPREMELPPGLSVAAFGDSVMSGSAPALYARFPGIYINAKPSMQWHDAPAMIKQMTDRGIERRVVILNYGTNAGFKEPQSEQALRGMLDTLGPETRVVLINTVGYSYWVPSSNERLRQISSEYPNTIVADWWSVAHDRADLLHRDKTHPNEAGTAIYVNVIADALKRLGPE